MFRLAAEYPENSYTVLHAYLHSIFLQNIDMLSCKCLVHASYCTEFTSSRFGSARCSAGVT